MEDVTTPALYVIGHAGAGKSTFVAQLLGGYDFGELTDLHSKRNTKVLDTLRGHPVTKGPAAGMYLGVNRASFPGTDALARSTSPVAAEWVTTRPLPGFVVGEGATLASRRFMAALEQNTDLIVLNLHCAEDLATQRFAQRGSTQKDSFVKSTATRSHNLAQYLRKLGVLVLDVDTGAPQQWARAQGVALEHLTGVDLGGLI